MEEWNYSFTHFLPFHQIAVNGQYHVWEKGPLVPLNTSPVGHEIRSECFGVKISLLPLTVNKQQFLRHPAYCIVTTIPQTSSLLYSHNNDHAIPAPSDERTQVINTAHTIRILANEIFKINSMKNVH